MSAIHIGDILGLHYQADQPTQLNPDGSASSTITFKCDASAGVTVVPAYLSSHPQFSELKCYESVLNYENGSIQSVSVTYRGVWSGADTEALAQYDFARSTTEAPIETHPLFSVPYDTPPVTAKELAKINLALDNAQPPTGLGTAATILYNKKLRGIESYLKPGGVFKKSYVSSSYPDSSLMELVGKIHDPGTPAPTAPTGQNYLCVGISWNKTAGVVSIAEEYQLSGPGGWDPVIYASS